MPTNYIRRWKCCYENLWMTLYGLRTTLRWLPACSARLPVCEARSTTGRCAGVTATAVPYGCSSTMWRMLTWYAAVEPALLLQLVACVFHLHFCSFTNMLIIESFFWVFNIYQFPEHMTMIHAVWQGSTILIRESAQSAVTVRVRVKVSSLSVHELISLDFWSIQFSLVKYLT